VLAAQLAEHLRADHPNEEPYIRQTLDLAAHGANR
jgi:hypothetical protein